LHGITYYPLTSEATVAAEINARAMRVIKNGVKLIFPQVISLCPRKKSEAHTVNGSKKSISTRLRLFDKYWPIEIKAAIRYCFRDIIHISHKAVAQYPLSNLQNVAVIKHETCPTITVDIKRQPRQPITHHLQS
jgi:hypothetical protein